MALKITYHQKMRLPVAHTTVKGFPVEIISNDPRVRLDHETQKIHVPSAEIGKSWINAGADESQIVVKK